MGTGTIVDVPGIEVGSVEDCDAMTGCTAVVFPDRAICGMDIGGGATGSRELALLAPTASMDAIDAIVLTGGSAFGLDAACGAANFLEERGRGAKVGKWRVPIVPAAVLFDLDLGDGRIRPNADMGRRAVRVASKAKVRAGNFGAGCGATVGKLGGIQYAMKGGIGSSSAMLPHGLIVGAIAVVNALGDIREPSTGQYIAGRRDLPKKTVAADVPSSNTTLVVVGTNAKLTKAEATFVARRAQDGISEVVVPAHTSRDGDVVFAVSTGRLKADLDALGSAASVLVAQAIVRGVYAAETFGTVPGHLTLCKSQSCPHETFLRARHNAKRTAAARIREQSKT